MMFIRLLCLLILMGSFNSHIEAGLWDTIKSYFVGTSHQHPHTIKVLIVNDSPGVVVEVRGKYKLYDPKDGSHISTRFVGKRRFIEAEAGGIRWGEEFPGIHQILIIPDAASVATFVDGIEYHGKIYIYDIGGSVSIVNEVNIEDYLSSVLSSQFQKNIPKEALSAIVIAARTNALYQSLHPKTSFWNVDANITDYQGLVKDHLNTEIDAIIHETRGMILSNNGGLFPAQWGSSTGGSSTNSPATFSRISLFEVESLAGEGENAAQILSKAFPGATIQLIQ